MPTYTQSQLEADIGGGASGMSDIQNLVNRAVREVIGEIDLRSTKRMSYLAPYVNQDQYDYKAPSDIKENAIIDLRRMDTRQVGDKFQLCTTEYFDRHKTQFQNLICIEDQNFLKKLRVSADLQNQTDQATVHSCESLTADGTWAASASASNLTLDTTVFLEGDASFNFDMGASYTSGLLTNSTLAAQDLSTYTSGGSIFISVDIPSTTGLTSFKLRIGTDASNYYEMTATATNENLAFQSRWNLLRFDFVSATQTGTVTNTSIGYLRFEIVGAGTASATTDWRIDSIVARTGVEHQVWYYTKLGWQTSAGSYIENSTASTDLINCDTEEYALFIMKAKQITAEDQMLWKEADIWVGRYEKAKQNYLNKYSSERLMLIQNYRSMTTEFQDSTLMR